MYICVSADVTPVQVCINMCMQLCVCVPLPVTDMHNHVSTHVCSHDGIAQARGRAHEDRGDKKMSPNDQKEQQQKARHGIRVV